MTARKAVGGPRVLAETVQRGDSLASLQALRDRLAAQLDATSSARDVAALSRQLTDVLARIESFAGPEPSRVVGEIAARRDRRRRAALRTVGGGDV